MNALDHMYDSGGVFVYAGATREEVDIYSLGVRQNVSGVKGSEVIYTLYQEQLLYAKGMRRSLLRTNTTRPSKCDRTANTMGG